MDDMKLAYACLLLLSSVPLLAAAQSTEQPPEVLDRIQAAHRIFVSNGGQNATMASHMNIGDKGYEQLYRELAKWPGIQLVGSPTQADLIFQSESIEDIAIDRVEAVNSRPDDPNKPWETVTFQFRLTVLDPTTNKVIWTNQTQFPLALTKSEVMARAADKVLAPIEPSGKAPSRKVTVLVPTQLRSVKKLFFEIRPAPKSNPQDAQDVEPALKQALSQEFAIVDSVADADLVLALDVAHYQYYGPHPLRYMTVDVLDPKTHTLLWRFTTNFTRDFLESEQIPRTLPSFLKNWDSVIGKHHF